MGNILFLLAVVSGCFALYHLFNLRKTNGKKPLLMSLALTLTFVLALVVYLIPFHMDFPAVTAIELNHDGDTYVISDESSVSQVMDVLKKLEHQRPWGGEIPRSGYSVKTSFMLWLETEDGLQPQYYTFVTDEPKNSFCWYHPNTYYSISNAEEIMDELINVLQNLKIRKQD